jgi:Delta7-sterol 5-desaturase
MLGLVYLVDSAVFCKIRDGSVIKIDPVGALKTILSFEPHSGPISGLELVSEFLSLTLLFFSLSFLLYFVFSGTPSSLCFLRTAILSLRFPGLDYFYFFYLKREKYFPKFVPDWVMQRKEIKWTMYSIGGNAFFHAACHMMIHHGWTRVYFNFSDHSLAHMILSVVGLFFFTEFGVYWAHRSLHEVKWMYVHLHKPHHLFLLPTPFASLAFHPVDSFLQFFPYHVYLFLVPMHAAIYLLALGAIMLWAVAIHDRLTYVPDGLVLSTGYHTVHHYRNHGSGKGYNYGQYTVMFDWLFGTLKKPEGPVELVDFWHPNESKKLK